jgi:hypothetical protein
MASNNVFSFYAIWFILYHVYMYHTVYTSQAGVSVRCTCSKDVKGKEEARDAALRSAKLLIW